MTDTVIIRDDIVEPVLVDVDGVDTLLVDDAPGPPGRSITVHWDTVAPEPTDGNVGDLWVVTL